VLNGFIKSLLSLREELMKNEWAGGKEVEIVGWFN
jgi:hypothetical protein